MFICLHLSSSMSENPLKSQILHAVSMPYDDDMVNMHVCILALSQVTLQCAVCMLCNGIIIIQPGASGSWSCLYTTTLFTPVPGCQSIPLICLHGIVCHVQSRLVMKTHKVHANLLHVKGFHLPVLLWCCTQCVCTLNWSSFFYKPGVKWRSREMINLQAWEGEMYCKLRLKHSLNTTSSFYWWCL